MARTLNRLTAREVAIATQPGMYPDGAGLYLRVARGGKSWVLRYMLDGNAREMGLGGLEKVGLADARKKAAEQHCCWLTRSIRSSFVRSSAGRKSSKLRAP
jgi:hypothetical protein